MTIAELLAHVNCCTTSFETWVCAFSCFKIQNIAQSCPELGFSHSHVQNLNLYTRTLKDHISNAKLNFHQLISVSLHVKSATAFCRSSILCFGLPNWHVPQLMWSESGNRAIGHSTFVQVLHWHPTILIYSSRPFHPEAFGSCFMLRTSLGSMQVRMPGGSGSHPWWYTMPCKDWF